jgi:hypothetical protein
MTELERINANIEIMKMAITIAYNLPNDEPTGKEAEAIYKRLSKLVNKY